MIKNAKEAYLLSKANETDTDEFIDSVLLREVQSAAENGDYDSFGDYRRRCFDKRG